MRVLPLLLGGVLAASAQVTPDPKLRTSRDTYSPVMEVLKASRTPVTDAQLEKLRSLPLESVWASLQRLGYTNCYYAGLKSTRPKERLVGRALTIRYLPRRPDLAEAMATLSKEGDWPRGYNVRAAEEAKPGDVLVVDLGGTIPDGVFFGDISAIGAKVAGARGAILWGSTRDKEELEAIEGFPVLANGFDPSPALQIGVDWNIPIRVGNVTVLPGDVVVADSEAAIFFPPQLAATVIEQAAKTAEQENYERDLARKKLYRFRDVYPLNPELRKKYEAERNK